MDKKTAEKLLRKKQAPRIFYYFDKIFRFYSIKVLRVEEYKIENYPSNGRYRVKYKKGMNLFNPFTWVLILVIFIVAVVEGAFRTMREILSDTFKELKHYESSDIIRVEEDK